jgi:hypothetical protein
MIPTDNDHAVRDGREHGMPLPSAEPTLSARPARVVTTPAGGVEAG